MHILKTYHAQVKQQVEQTLQEFFDAQIKIAKSKDQVLVDSVEVLKEFVLRGGKRVSPLVLITASRIAQQTLNRDPIAPLQDDHAIWKLAAATEIHHLYLLNLDDMADRDELRHGGKTLEAYYRDDIFNKWPDADHHGRTFSSINGALLNFCTFELIGQAGLDGATTNDLLHIVSDNLFNDTIVGWQIQYFQNHQPLDEASEDRF